ncbi:CDPF1 isoform 7 [Pongo abelii]|uniref:Cysteine-rich DPF motif domain-containing protein 1 n=1 Tax=Pongo abelii TaxID=9601 RepID=A0A2J8TW24_PONAB|nr:CDPF1 isoform 7 [Pongo abelii]
MWDRSPPTPSRWCESTPFGPVPGRPVPSAGCLLEESYVMKDPFTSDKDRFLVLGSRCSLCSRLVCVGPECSLFYSKRFCLPCVRENISAFPQEIRQDLEKRKAPSKRTPSQPGSRT